MFFYFLSGGNLPWQGVKSSNVKKRYQLIGQIKEDTKLATLGYGHPREFETYTRLIYSSCSFQKCVIICNPLGIQIVNIQYFRYCRGLKFSQAPDYDYLKNIFRTCLARNNLKEDGIFDWSPKDSIPFENKGPGHKPAKIYNMKTPETLTPKVSHCSF